MYILNGAKDQLVNSEYVERFCVSNKSDAALIVASYSTERPAVTLARYKDAAEAKNALENMMYALSGGQSYYVMPDSTYYCEEHVKKDARTKRKGKS